ncbi:MAG: DUF6089 family protein [Bacteroidota bacterium]
MHLNLKAVLAIFILFFFFADDALAQRRRRGKYKRRRASSKRISKYKGGRVFGGAGRFRPYHYVGGGINAFNYFGDLAPVNRAASTDISFTRPGFAAIYGRRFHPVMAFRAAYNFGVLRGDDVASAPSDNQARSRYYRNLSFRSFIHEVSMGVEFHVLPNYRRPAQRPPFNGYIFLGIAGFHHNPQGKAPDFDYQVGSDTPLPAGLTPGEWVNLQELGTEGQFLNDPELRGEEYSKFQIAIPLGIGARIAFPGNNLNVGIELGYRYVFTDYLDDVSTTFVNLDRFNDPVARIFSDRGAEPIAAVTGEARNQSILDQVIPVDFNGTTYNVPGQIRSNDQTADAPRGNPNDNDMYFITQIRVTYILNGGGRRTFAKFR